MERISRKIATEKVRKPHWSDGDPELQAMEREFTETLGTRVQILRTEYGGRMTIDYFSPEDLRKILDMIHRGDTQTPLTQNESELLSRLTAAVPLVPVALPLAPLAPAPSFSLSPSPSPSPSFSSTLSSVLTPEISSEVPPDVVVEDEVIPETVLPDEVVFTKHDSLDEPVTPDAVLDQEILEEAAEEDEDLYSIKNFSL